jgi:hypothetical protein
MATRKATRRKTTARTGKPRTGRKWSAGVNERSDALDIKKRTFTGRNPRRIAQSLKRSAEHSHRRKAGPFQSAMSMLNFYINRGGRNLSAAQKSVLMRAKDELRKLFDRAPAKRTTRHRAPARRDSRKRAQAAA